MSRIVAVCALLLASFAGVSAGAPARAAEGPPVVLALADGEEGLAWRAPAAGSAPGAPIELAALPSTELGWDLTALEPSAYRGDLLSVAVAEVEGPGRFTVTALSPFGRRVLLLDPAAGLDETVLQLGRAGTFRWEADVPGRYVVHLTATVPTRDGVARADATYVVEVGPGGPPDSGGAGSSPAADPAPSSGAGAGPSGSGTPSGDEVPRSSEGGTLGTSPDEHSDRVLGATYVAPAAGAVASVATASAAQAGSRVVIDEGHVDMGPRLVDGAWRVQLKDDTVSPHVWRDLADVVLHAHDAARLEVPAGGTYAFLGDPGATVYVLPQVQESGLVWPGWNTQDPSVLEAVPGPVAWRLRGVDGPGRFVLYLAGSFGDVDVLFDTADPLPQELSIGRNTHVHGNWAFTAPGVYRLSVEMAATTSGGQALADTRVLTIVVGDGIDPTTAFGADVPDPGTGTSTTVPGAGGAGDATVAGTGRTTAGGSTSGRGGALARTGAAGLGVEVAWGASLVVVGLALVAGRRRLLHRKQIESHS
ncbi:MAG: TIGR03773 family transporter-associated surface protein [Acidimicrobiia bacterium]